ncbi:MAG: TetR/AcrR family transcriptional regulator [Gemmatimonadaceae bacterium]
MTDQQVLSERGRRDGDTERRILTAARTVFMRRGTAGARMQEIAEEAGVNQALLHYYFRSKEGLAEAVFREAASGLIPSAVRVLGSDATLEEKVEQFVHLYIDTVRQHPFIPGYVLAELHHHPQRLAALVSELAGPAATPAGMAFIQRLGAQLRERAATGAIRPIAPHQFFVNLLSLCVFPFVARPLLLTVLGMDEEAFGRFLDERRAELPGFVLNALRP